ncbi:MAG TPA: type IV pilin [Methanocorpusculum sp.]|nr:type IV pilin [Methanocorpusculum sp.]
MTKESAVSPVVGVMLMLVVTIIIAAVVAAFASGVVTTTSSTPTATLQVVGVDGGDLVFMHNGGDAFNIQEVTLLLQGAEEGSTPREYSTENKLSNLTTMNGGKSGKIGTGDRFKVHDIRLGTDAFVRYTLQSSKSGNTITTGTFTMPAGVRSALPTATPAKLALSWADPVTYEYKQAVSLSAGDATVFYLNAVTADGEKIPVSTADSAYIIVTKSGETPVNVNYDAASYGFPYTFTDAGSYTVSAVVNTHASDYHLEGNYPTADGNKPSTWTSGGSISVTVA